MDPGCLPQPFRYRAAGCVAGRAACRLAICACATADALTAVLNGERASRFPSRMGLDRSLRRAGRHGRDVRVRVAGPDERARRRQLGQRAARRAGLLPRRSVSHRSGQGIRARARRAGDLPRRRDPRRSAPMPRSRSELPPSAALADYHGNLIAPGLPRYACPVRGDRESSARRASDLLDWLDTLHLPRPRNNRRRDIGARGPRACSAMNCCRNGTTTALVFCSVHPAIGGRVVRGSTDSLS